MLKYILSVLLFLTVLGCQGGGGSASASNATGTTHFLSVQSVLGGDSVISIKPKITLKFSAALDGTTVSDSTVYIAEENTNSLIGAEATLNPIGAETTLLSDPTMIEITPYTYLKSNTTYKIVVTTALKDTQGRSLSENYYFTFRTLNETRDSAPLTLRSIKPASGSNDNLRDTTITLDFSKSLSLEPKSYIKVQDESGNQITGTTQIFNSFIIFKPDNLLPADNNITIELINAPTDIYGDNTYDLNSASQWWFQTRAAQNSIDQNNTGFATLDSLISSDGVFDIQTLYDGHGDSSVAVASSSQIHLLTVSYTDSLNGVTTFTKPVLSSNQSYDAPSSITSIATNTIDSISYIYAALENNTIVVLNDSLHKVSQIQVAHPVYKLVTLDASHLIALEPGYGFEVFNTAGGTLSLSKKLDNSTSTTYLDALIATGYDQDAQTNLTKIYLADYEGGVDIYDTNLTFLNRLDLNGSIKFLAKNEDYTGVLGLYAISASGKLQGFDFNGSISPYVTADLPARCYDIENYMGDFTSGIYYTFGDRGIYSYSSDYPQYKFHTDTEIIASSIVENSVLKQPFLVSIDRSATIRVSNLTNDSYAPYISFTTPYDGQSLAVDGNVTIAFGDDYMDYANVSTANFRFYDVNTSTEVPFSMSMGYNIEVGLTYVLSPSAYLNDRHEYSITLDKNVSDMIGNVLPKGTTVTNFTATIQGG